MNELLPRKAYLRKAGHSDNRRESGDLGNAGGFYHRGPALALGEARRFVFVGVHAAKLFAVGVVDTHQPMVMFAAAVPGEGILVFVGSVFCHFARLSL